MNYQARGFSLSLFVHAAVLTLFISAAGIVPAKKRVIFLDFSILDGAEPASGKAEKKVEEVKKAEELNPKTAPKPVEKRKAVEEAKRKLVSEKKEAAIDKVQSVAEEVVAAEVKEPAEEIVKGAELAEEVIEHSPIEAAAKSPAEPVGAREMTTPADIGSESTVDSSASSSSESYMKEHFMYIKEKIRKQVAYPSIARKRGLQGKVVISFIICADGSVTNVNILESSGHAILDKNAVKTVKKAAPFPKPPVRAELIVPISFRLS